MNTQSPEIHDYAAHYDGLWWAECSCGWSGGEGWDDADDAQLEWDDHTDDVFYKATLPAGLDGDT
jgi:hypothetical protein